MAEFAYNNIKNANNSYTPFKLNYNKCKKEVHYFFEMFGVNK